MIMMRNGGGAATADQLKRQIQEDIARMGVLRPKIEGLQREIDKIKQDYRTLPHKENELHKDQSEMRDLERRHRDNEQQVNEILRDLESHKNDAAFGRGSATSKRF